jgi:hypothetical protein
MTGSTSAVRVAVNTRGLQNVMKRAVILSKGRSPSVSPQTDTKV